MLSLSVMSDSLQFHGLSPTSLWDYPGKNTKVELPFPLSRDLPDAGIEPTSPVAPVLEFFTTDSPAEAQPHHIHYSYI